MRAAHCYATLGRTVLIIILILVHHNLSNHQHHYFSLKRHQHNQCFFYHFGFKLGTTNNSVYNHLKFQYSHLSNNYIFYHIPKPDKQDKKCSTSKICLYTNAEYKLAKMHSTIQSYCIQVHLECQQIKLSLSNNVCLDIQQNFKNKFIIKRLMNFQKGLKVKLLYLHL